MSLPEGTLVISAHGNNFVVLGADSIGMMGDLNGPMVVGSTRSRKIRFLAEHVAVAIYGSAPFGEHLIDLFRTENDGVTTVMNEFWPHCRDVWNGWFERLSLNNQPHVGFLFTGLDNINGSYEIPRTYSLESWFNFAPALHTYGYACGGIPSLANYILDNRYRENMEIDELINLVDDTISEVARSEPRIRLPVRVALITGLDGVRMVRESEI